MPNLCQSGLPTARGGVGEAAAHRISSEGKTRPIFGANPTIFATGAPVAISADGHTSREHLGGRGQSRPRNRQSVPTRQILPWY
jgi:hypothetical protein